MNFKSRSALFILTLGVLLFSMDGLAQNSKGNKNESSGARNTTFATGIGLRGGFEGGITFKHFLKSTSAVEGILSRGWGYGGLRITGLYEMQKALPNTKSLDWFWGIGAHVGFYDGSYYGYYGYYGNGYFDHNGVWHSTGYQSHYTTLGIDGILGLEYQFTDLPITVSADIKPFFDIFGRGSHYGDGAFSIRYVLK